MNPPEAQPGLQLPAPVAEHAPQPSAGPAEGLPQAAEQASNPAQQQPVQAAPLAPPLPPMPAPAATTTPSTDAVVTTSASSTMTADDGDLIEKEWVHRAKKIVEANRDDPYKQSEELTVVKADYMQKRYNKTIKLSK